MSILRRMWKYTLTPCFRLKKVQKNNKELYYPQMKKNLFSKWKTITGFIDFPQKSRYYCGRFPIGPWSANYLIDSVEKRIEYVKIDR